MHKKNARAICIVIMVAFLAGCSASGTPDAGGEPPLEPIPNPLDMRTLALPLDAYKPSEESKVTIARARVILLVDCMQRFGFNLQAPTPGLPTLFGRNEERYGITTEDQATKYGYHPAPERIHEPLSETPLSAAAESVMMGKGQNVYAGNQVPEGGCAGEASRTLSDGAVAVDNPQFVDQLRAMTYIRSQEDSRTRDVFVKWSDCMQKSGFHYDRPMDANNDPAFRTDTPSATEIATAIADVHCKAEHDVVETWLAVEIAYQKREVEKNAEILKIIQLNLDAQIRNANRMLAEAVAS